MLGAAAVAMWWNVAPENWVLLMGGYDVEAVRKSQVPEGIVGFYRPAYSLSAGETA